MVQFVHSPNFSMVLVAAAEDFMENGQKIWTGIPAELSIDRHGLSRLSSFNQPSHKVQIWHGRVPNPNGPSHGIPTCALPLGGQVGDLDTIWIYELSILTPSFTQGVFRNRINCIEMKFV